MFLKKIYAFALLMLVSTSCSETYPKAETIKGAHGQVLSTYSVDEKGQKQGLETNFYEEGIRVKSEIYYVDGLKNGITKTYFENGEKASVVEYSLNQPIGKAIYYNENGQTRREETYTDESKLIRTISYYASGRLKEFATYLVSDKKMYQWKYYNEFGELIPRKSNFIEVRKLKGQVFEAKIIHPEYTDFDSVIVYSTEDIRAKNHHDIIKKRKMKFNNSPFEIAILEEDFHYTDINYLILAYPKTKTKVPIELDYRLFWSRSEPIPVDNLRPIFRN